MGQSALGQQQFPGPLQEILARAGQHDATAKPVEEYEPEFLFQPGDALAQGRLRDVQPGGRTHEAAFGSQYGCMTQFA